MPLAGSTPTQETRAPGTVEGVGELIRLLIKTAKAMRLYLSGNELTDRLQEALLSGIKAALDEEGALELDVTEFSILWHGETVYQSSDRKDSLAHLLHRDGIRHLSFHPGLDREELLAFLRCLNQAAVLTGDLDDLVTLLWSQDFRSIRYAAVSELASEMEESGLQQQLASGALGERPGPGGGGGGAGAGSGPDEGPADRAGPPEVSLKDLPQPASCLPIEECRLTDDEIRLLRRDLLEEEAADPDLTAVELALELAMLEDDEEERLVLAAHLVSILRQRLRQGEVGPVVECLGHLAALTEKRLSGSAEARALRSRVMHSVTESDFMEIFIMQAERSRSFRPESLTALLTFMEEPEILRLLPLLGRPRTPALRRALTEGILASGSGFMEPLALCLDREALRQDTGFLNEAFHLLAHAEGPRALGCLEGLMGSGSPSVRQRTARALGRFRHGGADELCLRLLDDGDPEVRAAALDTLARHGRRELARPLFEKVVMAPGFRERHIAERRRVLAAVARLAGEQALDWFLELLQGRGRWWIPSRKDREMAELAVHGISRVDSGRTTEILEELRTRGQRWLRSACARELEGRTR